MQKVLYWLQIVIGIGTLIQQFLASIHGGMPSGATSAVATGVAISGVAHAMRRP